MGYKDQDGHFMINFSTQGKTLFDCNRIDNVQTEERMMELVEGLRKAFPNAKIEVIFWPRQTGQFVYVGRELPGIGGGKIRCTEAQYQAASTLFGNSLTYPDFLEFEYYHEIPEAISVKTLDRKLVICADGDIVDS